MTRLPAILLVFLLVTRAGAQTFTIGTVTANYAANKVQYLAPMLTNYIDTLAAGPSAQTFYVSHLNLSTNQAVWTWPVNFSCIGANTNVGAGTFGYQTTLISSNLILANQHYGGQQGQLICFRDTNGVLYSSYCTQSVYLKDDIAIGKLSNAMPASVVPAWVLPVSFTNNIPGLGGIYGPSGGQVIVPGHSIVGYPCIWFHDNANLIQYSTNNGNSFIPPEEMGVTHNPQSPNGNGSASTDGDSGSPAFMLFSNNPVILFANTGGGYDAYGDFISGNSNWTSIAQAGLTNGIHIINLAGFQTY